MTTYNTGNPLGSAAAKDLFDNAQNMDFALNDMTQAIWSDRFGRNRKTWYGIEGDFLSQLANQEGRFNLFIQNSGYEIIGDYVDGPLTINEYNQLIRYEGEFYKLNAATDTPYHTTGNTAESWIVDSAHFVSVGDATLRQDLLSTEAGRGDALVAVKQPFTGSSARTQHDKNFDFVSILDFEGVVLDGITDCHLALSVALQSGKTIYWPRPEPGQFALVSNTVLIGNGTQLIGPGKDFIVIKAADNFPNDRDVLSSANFATGDQEYDEYLSIRDLGIDANGWERALSDGTATSTALTFGNVRHSEIINVRCINAPKWNFKINSFNPYEDIGHAGTPTAPSYNILISGCRSEDFIHGDGLIIQGSFGVTIDNYTQIISDDAKSLLLYTKTHSAIQIVDGSHDVIVQRPKTFGNGTMMTAYSANGHTLRPAVYNIAFINVFAHGVHSLVSAWNDTVTDVTFGTDQWLGRNVNVNGGVLIKPTLDVTNNDLPARLVDFQHQMHCHANNVNVVITDDDGTYSSPVAISNFLECVDTTLDGMSASKVPAIPVGNYTINRGIGWVITGTIAGSKNIRIRNINLNNIGYINRVISDIAAVAVKEARNVHVDAIPSDGQTKIGIYSSAFDAELTNFNLPTSMEKYRVGQFLTSYPYKNIKVSLNYGNSSIIGGMVIRAESNSGVQNVSGIVFDRTFASSSDPIGAFGKGSIAFRTSDATPGTFSICAYHEDLNQYRPIVYARSSTTPVKSWNPVVDNDTNLGETTNRWKQISAATSTIVTSDATHKTEVLDVSAIEKKVATKLKGMIKKYKKVDAVEEKGTEKARYHFGVIAQDIAKVFEEFGLDPSRYGLFCYDKWDDEFIVIPPVDEVVDDDTREILVKAQPEFITQTRFAGERYGIRYEELICFMISAM